MKAIYLEQYGNTDQLIHGELQRPKAATGQVVIKVHGAGVNPVDWMVREGLLREDVAHAMPLVPGWDAAGVISEIGEGVNNFEVGQPVFVYSPIALQGAYAEYLLVDSALVANKPNSLDFITSAAVPLAATTAYQSLIAGGNVKPGQRVLIHNAAGGVGSFAVQIAKALGAYVIGTASQGKHDFVSSLGADEVIDYRSENFLDTIEDVDMVLAAVGGDNIVEDSLQVIKPGGVLISLLDDMPSAEAQAKAQAKNIEFQRWWVTPNAQDLTHIAAMIDNGDIKVHLEKVFPLSQVKQAHALSESKRAQGKIVLQVID